LSIEEAAVKSEKIRRIALPVRKAFDDLERELLEVGKLSPETIARFEEQSGVYFPRLYASKEFAPKAARVVTRTPPIRSGTPRLLERGERIDVEIPDLNKLVVEVERGLGKTRFLKEFRRALRTKAHTATTEARRTVRSGEPTRTVETVESVAEEGGKTAPLAESGPIAKLETIVTDALELRGMVKGEAQAVIGRIKASGAAVTDDIAAEAGKTVITKTVKETERVETVDEILRTVKESIDIDGATEAALRAFGRLANRLGSKGVKVRAAGRELSVRPIANVESGKERLTALNSFLRAGFKVEKRQGRKVTLHRDIPEAERKAMGEMTLTDPGFVAAKGVAQIQRELAVTRFFKAVSDNGEWTSLQPAEGFTRMGTDQVRFGSLAGKYVRDDVASEINESTRILADWERFLGRLTTWWKTGKVLNPSTVARNWYSSGILADWGGLSWHKPAGIRSYSGAITGFSGENKATAALLKEFRDAGGSRATFNQQEINRLVDGFKASKDPSMLIRGMDAVGDFFSGIGGDKLTKAYGAVDHFYKGALYIHARRELGHTHQLAMRYAKKWGIDYEDVSPTVRLLRRMPIGAPFITFSSKAIPLAVETALKHPVRFAKYLVPIGISNELSKRSWDNDRLSVEQVQDLGNVRSPRYAIVGAKDGSIFPLDLGYIHPGGEILEAYDLITGGTEASLSFLPIGGPGIAIINAAVNYDPFRQKHISRKTDTLAEATAKRIDYLGKALLPALGPPIPGTGFRGGHSTEAFRRAISPGTQLKGEAPMSATDFFGRRVTLGTVIASKIFGINIKEVRVQDVERLGLMKLDSGVKELIGGLIKIERGGFTEPQQKEKSEQTIDKLNELVNDTMERLGLGTPAQKRRGLIEDR
jgi:hypothetical protein